MNGEQVSTVTVSGTDVALRMASVITSFLTVAVTYTDPTAGVNDTKAIQDAAGNDAANLVSLVGYERLHRRGHDAARLRAKRWCPATAALSR